jgi:hypothetical protein
VGDLLKAFERFIARDLILITSGGIVVLSFLSCFDRVPHPEDSWALYLLLGGVAYFVGLTIQDVFSVMWAVSTAAYTMPQEDRFRRWLYRRYNGKGNDRYFRTVEIDLEYARDTIRRSDDLDRLERIVTLKQAGTAGGPCLVVAGTLLLLHWFKKTREGPSWEWFDVALPVASIVIGILLIWFSWVRAAQQTQFLVRRGKHRPPPWKETEGEPTTGDETNIAPTSNP